MTSREKEILELLKKNPQISQQELADILGITRSSAAVHITNLMKKGYILGKGYLLKAQDYVVVIGGANIDIHGFPKIKLIPRDSNPGNIKTSPGGVGRNIAENLSKLGVAVKLLSALGEDLHGENLLKECKKSGIDMDHCYFSKDFPTSTYLCILDHNGDMFAAIADMKIQEKISVEYIREKAHIIDHASVAILDTNLPEDTLTYLLQHFHSTDFFLDPVSTTKAEKVKDKIGLFHTIKPNRMEAEILSGASIRSEADLKTAAIYFFSKGVKRVFITLGEDGLYCGEPSEQYLLQSPKVSPVNATGAGDAFMAALAYCHTQQMSLKDTAHFATAASIVALSHEDTIHPLMSIDTVQKKLRELNL
ncbi:PfkB family carbohydrate kinase [Geosporobacter ferrireducens]|uniref:Kinase n=1 Tax=Geosporobacter ferrireducens TaxID=1424294 RepID=A0A1D8GE00_9FIRM|nr:PfkB family carbohydrate kinase [Geosporobacter ferrireducens]AOT69124.1 kinase [Geosporobacter ferrireducens]MTI56800.1 winged helix-turn-helix transcriptional regulator [Geosporobacter ferrireducens]